MTCSLYRPVSGGFAEMKFVCVDLSRIAAILTLLAAVGFSSVANAYVTPRIKPAAPDPIYLSTADHARLDRVITALKRKQFSTATAVANTIQDPIAKSLGQWLYFYHRDPNVNVRNADEFLDLHGHWPAVSRIQAHLEKQLKSSTSPDLVLELFKTRDPVSGSGKIHLANALFSKGDDEAGEIHLRDAWVNHSLSSSQEKRILARHGKRLHIEDHTARVDHLLWKRQVTNARRTFPLLTSTERRKAQTRAALLVRAKNAQSLFDGLNDTDRSDSGVTLAAVRYFRRGGEEPRAVSIARTASTDPATLRNPSRWWFERSLLIRWALREKKYGDAYAMAAGHGLEPSTEFSEAEFYAGWLALRYLGNAERAETHFKAIAATVSAPISIARAHYWLGRAAEAQQKQSIANEYYQIAATHFYTFYGQLAAEKIGGDALAQSFQATGTASANDSTRFASRPTVAALRMLSELDDDQAFLVFSYHVDDRLETPGEFLELANITNSRGAPHITVRAGKVSVRRKAFAPEVSYPIVFVPDEASRYAPAEVILGLSRQESEFNPRAFSRAGARGMMQLIPSTAQITARKEGLRYSRSALLDDPIYNMTIGSAHLSHLFEKYNGSYLMTFAAYNAGPHRVTQWVEAFGDPRSSDVDPIDWAESIPFSETRNYVQRVLENTQVYRGRFSNGPIPGKLSRDLERGGNRGRAGSVPGKSYADALFGLPDRTKNLAETFVLASLAPATQAPVSPSTPIHQSGTQDGAEKTGASSSVAQDQVQPEPAPAEPVPSPSQSQPANQQAQETIERTIDANLNRAGTLPAVNSAAVQKTVSPTKSVAETPDVQPTPVGADIPKEPLPQIANPLPKIPEPKLTEPETTNSAPRESLTAPISEQSSDPEIVAKNPAATVPEDCETYRSYIARTEKEEASAADLNVGMLAEIKGDGPGCPSGVK